MNYIDELWYLLRIFVALVFGFAIGWERKIRYKEAGIRTHSIVSVGACLMMVISKYGFGDVAGSDGARIAAQIVSGIGFLGAGIIMYRRDSLRGVTTAAGIWTTAGVGMAIGAGQYILAAGATILIVFIQWLTHLPLPIFRSKQFYIYRIKFVCSSDGDESDTIKSIFNVSTFSRINYYTSADKVNASAEISTKYVLSDNDIKNIVFGNEFISSIERIYQLDGKE